MISFRGVSKVFTIPHLRRRTLFRRLFAAGRFSYETFPALKGISFEVGAGEFVGRRWFGSVFRAARRATLQKRAVSVFTRHREARRLIIEVAADVRTL